MLFREVCGNIMNEKIKLSIAIITYNRPLEVKRAIESCDTDDIEYGIIILQSKINKRYKDIV